LRLQHGRLLRPLAADRPPRGGEVAEDLLRQLVPQGPRRAVPMAGVRRELARARLGVRPLRRARSGPGDTDRPDPPGRRRWNRYPRPGDLRRGDGRAASRRRRGVEGAAAPLPRALRQIRPPPGAAARAAEGAGGAALPLSRASRARGGASSGGGGSSAGGLWARPALVGRPAYSWPWTSPAAAGGRDSSASEVIVSAPR